MRERVLVGQTGEADRHRRPLAHLALDGQLPSELGDGLPHEDEAQGVELAVQRLSFLQELLDLLRGHAHAVVAHPQHDPVTFDAVADVEHADLAVRHGVHRIHDQVEVHPPETGPVATDHARVQLAELELHRIAALLPHVADDDVTGEVLQLLGDVELVVEVSALLLLQEVPDAAGDAEDPLNAVSIRVAGPDRSGFRRQELQDLVDSRPQCGLRIRSQVLKIVST